MPLVLLFGDNAVEIDEAARIRRKGFDPADVVTLDGLDVSLGVMSEACLTAGLFATERLVVVHGLHERMKATKKAVEETADIRAILESAAPTTTILLVDKDMAGDHRLVADVRALGGEIKSFVVPKKGDLPRWIVTRSRAAGTRIEPAAAGLLAELVGSNVLMLDSELNKLQTYAGAGVTVTPPMVEALVGAVPQDQIFALVDAVAARDQARAMILVREQLQSASATPIEFTLTLIRLLARQMRILLRIRLGQKSGSSQSQILSDLKIPRYFADRYFKQARNLSEDKLIAAFEHLADLEHRLKSGRAEAAVGLDLLIADLCT